MRGPSSDTVARDLLYFNDPVSEFFLTYHWDCELIDQDSAEACSGSHVADTVMRKRAWFYHLVDQYPRRMVDNANLRQRRTSSPLSILLLSV
jgi:hypothetical protein